MNIIYIHTNTVSGASYIGKTSATMEDRLKGHLRDMRNGSDYAFHRGIRKYGIEVFESKILEDNIPNEIVNERESYWIAYFDTFTGYGYNMTDGGEGWLKSEETKEKMRKPKTKTHALNISIGRMGMKFTDEHKLNMSKANLGKKLTEETKEKMRNKIVTSESNTKRSKALKGRLNPLKSSRIEIFNELGDLQFVSESNFERFCIEKNLPFSTLKLSYQHNKKIYQNITSGKKRSLLKKGFLKYQGWYAIKL